MTQRQQYAVVPVCATGTMKDCGANALPVGLEPWHASSAYRAMLEAAPPPPEQVLTEMEIQALWDEACHDTPSKPGWNRHIRFARAIERAVLQNLGAKNG